MHSPECRNEDWLPVTDGVHTPDPLGYEEGPNMYQFGLNNPIVNRDATDPMEDLYEDYRARRKAGPGSVAQFALPPVFLGESWPKQEK